VATATAEAGFTDNRFKWRKVTGTTGRVTVYWYSSNNTLGPSVAERASASLARLEGLMGYTYTMPIAIWVYSDLEALHSAISDGSRDWVGGQALVEEGVIQVFIPDSFGAQLEIAMAIPHEISHLVFYRATYPGRPPYWLNEGMAMVNQEEYIAEREIAPLREAAEDDRLIPLEDLDDTFSTNDGEQAALAYAQSRSLVEFIMSQYGRQSIGRILTAFRDGATSAEAIEEGLGITVTGLEREWLAALPYKPRQANTVAGSTSGTPPGPRQNETAGQWLTLIPAFTCGLLILGLIGLSLMSWVQRCKARAGEDEGEV
jgi:hypothetical protein